MKNVLFVRCKENSHQALALLRRSTTHQRVNHKSDFKHRRISVFITDRKPEQTAFPMMHWGDDEEGGIQPAHIFILYPCVLLFILKVHLSRFIRNIIGNDFK
ncbi:hypothetical protein OYC64_018486 [Pagothenia borchgrevinki]|uniref:Uncharacterized protein n=1 Tax=Pagothenia borchgrevinki TaxID=8213 RepID=A0ABD2GQ14_PAGBO